MIGGRQTALGLSSDKGGQSGSDNRMENDDVVVAVLARPSPLPDRVSDLEREAHRALLAKLGEKSIWLKYGSA